MNSLLLPNLAFLHNQHERHTYAVGAGGGGPLTKSAWDPAKLQLLFALGVPPWLHSQKCHPHVVI